MDNKLPTVDIKGKAYITVDTRVQEFHRLYPNGSIETMLLSEVNSNRIVMKSMVTPDVDKPNRMFTGYAQEMIGDGFINKASALENAETSSVGRALGFANIGLTDSIASVDEINKASAMSKSKDLNNPTPEQRQQVLGLMKELGMSYSPDSPDEWTEYCLAAIGVPNPLNVDQARELIAYMENDMLDREAERVSRER